MDHFSDIQLIEAAAGRLAPEERGRLEAHLKACPDCRARFAEALRTWDLLGEWQVSAAEHDVRGRLAAAMDEPGGPTIPLSPWRRWRRPMLAAAAVLIAAGIGHLAGRLVARRPAVSGDGQTAAVEVAEEAVADALALDALAGGRPVGLADALMAIDTGAETEESS